MIRTHLNPWLFLIAKHGVHHETAANNLDAPDLLVVAVKPQLMEVVLPGLVSIVTAENALLSVAAGTTISNLATPFEAISPRVIRAMPNTPAMVKRGITVCVGNGLVSKTQKEMVSGLLRAIGKVEWVEDERLMDAVTGVSGSGPAYIFHLTEALAAAGVKAGLSKELAGVLARETVSGAGELMHQSEYSPKTLRENVTSPNGTTAAALEVLMGKNGFPQLLERAVAAATKRSKELAD